MERETASDTEKSRLFWPWLPYLVAITGILLSLYLVYSRHLGSGLMPAKKDLWVDFTLTISISLLIAALIGMLQIIKQRALSIEKINITLKREIKERVDMENIKQKLEAALLQGQKLQAIGTLAGGIAHDFNNILYAIIGYTKLAQHDVAQDSLIYQNLGKILEGTSRGQELVSRILAFSRRQHQDYSAIKLKQVIEDALSLLKPTIPSSVNIEFISEFDPVINGSQNQIHQVIINLINNAVNAMDSEGTIRIHLSRLLPTDPVLSQFPDIIQQNCCKLFMTDTGHGMDQTTLKRIFEPFFTTKEVGKGTGLGLSIVHSIIKEHGGRITVSSKLGAGTAFTILLPEQIE